MKIGIITFWESYDNYGQQLQCWALQRFLLKKGHSPYLIRFKRQKTNSASSKKTIFVCLLKQIAKYILSIFNGNYYRQRCRAFEKFRSQHLKLSSNEYKNIAQLRACPPSADVYITGSDQVWNYEMGREELKAYYLQFGDVKTKRLSYAPSIGHPDIPNELRSFVANSLSVFDKISVRESSAVGLINSLGYNATHVVDPTMLLTKDDYSLIEEKSANSGKYVFVYSLNYLSQNDLPMSQIRNYIKDKEVSIRVTPSGGVVPGKRLFKDVSYDYSTIGQWLSNIHNSEMVVTASFHGIVLSIIYHKRFLYTPLKGWLASSNVRVLDLLSALNLNQQIWNEGTNIETYFENYIDWDSVDEKLTDLRMKSYEFLSCLQYDNVL